MAITIEPLQPVAIPDAPPNCPLDDDTAEGIACNAFRDIFGLADQFTPAGTAILAAMKTAVIRASFKTAEKLQSASPPTATTRPQ